MYGISFFRYFKFFELSGSVEATIAIIFIPTQQIIESTLRHMCQSSSKRLPSEEEY